MPKPIAQRLLPPYSLPLDRRSHASHDTCGPACTNPNCNESAHQASSAASDPTHTLIHDVPELAFGSSSKNIPALLLTGAADHTGQSCCPMLWPCPSIGHHGRCLGVPLCLPVGTYRTPLSSRGIESSRSYTHSLVSLSPL